VAQVVAVVMAAIVVIAQAKKKTKIIVAKINCNTNNHFQNKNDYISNAKSQN